jgi:hypothetical protein
VSAQAKKDTLLEQGWQQLLPILASTKERVRMAAPFAHPRQHKRAVSGYFWVARTVI